MTQITNPIGDTHTLAYDRRGQLSEETSFDQQKSKYTYDAAGNLFMSRGGFGYLMEFDYNADNGLESVTIDDTKYIRIVRDAAGRPVEYHFPGPRTFSSTATPLSGI